LSVGQKRWGVAPRWGRIGMSEGEGRGLALSPNFWATTRTIQQPVSRSYMSKLSPKARLLDKPHGGFNGPGFGRCALTVTGLRGAMASKDKPSFSGRHPARRFGDNSARPLLWILCLTRTVGDRSGFVTRDRSLSCCDPRPPFPLCWLVHPLLRREKTGERSAWLARPVSDSGRHRARGLGGRGWPVKILAGAPG
jgi:hypothetical protein